MDLIEGLAKQASQLTMYDVKSYYNQAKNMVLNVSETEAKVREATNDDPWGASSTLMQQIADGAQFNEIMPTIYSRFMEKEAREWRQIYKALTLLEFLVKNGSERVVDDARAHVSTIKMLRSFHYIDEKGKDQGINVRNRASEIAALLGDVERIRTERRKAKSNKNKYQGTGNDGGMSFVTATGNRYGGFGSDSLGGRGGSIGGGGSGGSSRYGGSNDNGDDYRSSSRGFRDTAAQQVEYDEYEGADDFEEDQPRRTPAASTSRSTRTSAPPKPVAKESKPAEKPKEVNLFDFGDDDEVSAPAPAAAAAAAASLVGGDDDFDDFQQAPAAPSPPPVASSAKPTNANLFDLLGSTSTTTPAVSAPRAPSLSGPAFSLPTPNYSSPPPAATPQAPMIVSRPSYSSASIALSPKPTGGSKSTFDDLFTTSLSSMGGRSTASSGQAGQGKSIKDLANEKASSSLWGPAPSSGKPAQVQPQASAKPAGGDFDDLLL
ncbi:hypothetical protein IAR55_004198 [Kwoniella newhampshirensis]|uniref:ENTH domain-containing protein n=1 Tax=Kwoniella newhampshirensis TaxID=1651941 RepID=A0AAW0YR62_9TREE